MGEVLVKDKEIVVPGQTLAKGMGYLPSTGAFREDDEIKASQVGVVNISGRLIKLIPLNGVYAPKRNDTIIGQIVDSSMTNWFIEFGYSKLASLSMRDSSPSYSRDGDSRSYYHIGDHIAAKIFKIAQSKIVDLTTRNVGIKRLTQGRIIKVSPVKVPRIIGKQGSMISLIKEKTNCKIVIGQNGIAWISGPDQKKENLAIKAIEKVEQEAHKEGLTDRIKEFLEKGDKNEKKK